MQYATIISMVFLVCWGAFFLTWIGGALYNALKGPKVLRRRVGSWRWWLIGIIGILMIRFEMNSTTYIHAASWSTLTFSVSELQIVGAILLIVGTLFTLWSRLVLGTMCSSVATVKSDHQLRTTGPYRITRHPIYTGILGMLAGTTLVYFVALPVLVVSVAIFLRKIADEERLMVEQFGEQYMEYKNRVPQLIPGLYLKRQRKDS